MIPDLDIDWYVSFTENKIKRIEGDRMKYPTITNPVVIDLSEDFERIEIIPMADLHIGG